jgi:hypothetical protein
MLRYALPEFLKTDGRGDRMLLRVSRLREKKETMIQNDGKKRKLPAVEPMMRRNKEREKKTTTDYRLRKMLQVNVVLLVSIVEGGKKKEIQSFGYIRFE